MSSNLKVVTVSDRTFILDMDKADEAFHAKRVINGLKTPYFNLLPLKYPWAYDLYRKMKANHWEPEDIEMSADIAQWHSESINDYERWIIKMAIGYFSAAEGIVGDNILQGVRELVTASELKLVLGRHAHEENIHADSLLYMISSLGINAHECEAMFSDVESIKAKNEFVTRISRSIRGDMDMTLTSNKQLLARNLFVLGQCMEGTMFYGLFGMVLALGRQHKFPGIKNMFRYTLRDESNHIELMRQLLMDLIQENPELWTTEFKAELTQLLIEAVSLEKKFIEDCLPQALVGLNSVEFCQYIDYIGDRRLVGCRLDPVNPGVKNPFPWLAEQMDLPKEENFFETKATVYQKTSALTASNDDDL